VVLRGLAAFGVDFFAPTPDERFHRLVGQRIDAGVYEIGQHRVGDIRGGPAGDDKAAAAVGGRGAFDQPGQAFAEYPVGGFVQPVQQHRTLAVFQLPLEEIGAQARMIGLAGCSQTMRQPGRSMLARGCGRLIRVPSHVRRPFADSQENGKGAVVDAQAILGCGGEFPQLRLAQGVRNAAEKGGLAGAGIADDDQPVVTQGLLQRNRAALARIEFAVRGLRGAPLAPAAPARRLVVDIAKRRVGGGQRHVQFFDLQPVRLSLAHVQAADVDVLGLVAEILQVLDGVHDGVRLARLVAHGRQTLDHSPQLLENLIVKAVLAAAHAAVGCHQRCVQRAAECADLDELPGMFGIATQFGLGVEVKLNPGRAGLLAGAESSLEFLLRAAAGAVGGCGELRGEDSYVDVARRRLPSARGWLPGADLRRGVLGPGHYFEPHAEPLAFDAVERRDDVRQHRSLLGHLVRC